MTPPDGGTDAGTETDAGVDAGTETGALGFTQVDCLPDPSQGAVVEGQRLQCSFRVTGQSGRSARLKCEDAAGAALECGSSSARQLQPFNSQPLPIEQGSFFVPTSELAGTQLVVVWVADDGVSQSRHRLEARIIADDGRNEPPVIGFNCGGDTDGSVRVKAGRRLSCNVRFLDPDPGLLSWAAQPQAGAEPRNAPSPVGGSGGAPYEVAWSWDPDATEAGRTFTYVFSADDGTALIVKRSLVVSVE
ncbi:MAG TPA: hypothetical protein VEU33_30240 [Archangium sp.]|nr:hypothetical protein [Archangium sp.]